MPTSNLYFLVSCISCYFNDIPALREAFQKLHRSGALHFGCVWAHFEPSRPMSIPNSTMLIKLKFPKALYLDFKIWGEIALNPRETFLKFARLEKNAEAYRRNMMGSGFTSLQLPLGLGPLSLDLCPCSSVLGPWYLVLGVQMGHTFDYWYKNGSHIEVHLVNGWGLSPESFKFFTHIVADWQIVRHVFNY